MKSQQQNQNSSQMSSTGKIESQKCQKQVQIKPVQLVMRELEELSEKIQNNQGYPLERLKQYIELYVKNHRRSQQFFNLMCEHNILAKLFSGISKPIRILEVFNLFLANTQQISELVYIFSHPLFHQYLLINFESFFNINNFGNNESSNESSVNSHHQCIEYYIQLLKTIVTKLQSESNQCTLLKLFCNSKYSSYPLLTNCIILAVRRNIKEELVRVTAQHCILQLIEIMSKKKVGEYYLSNLHMIIFFYEIISETISEETTESSNQDSTIKYLIDLLKAISLSQSIQAKQKSFILFFTILNNLIVFKFLKNPAPGLHLLLKLSNSFSQIEELQQMVSKYLAPIYFVFGKYLYNKYLSNVSLSSIILISQAISQLSELKEVSILKILKTQYEKFPIDSNDIETYGNSQILQNKSNQSFKHQSTPRKIRRSLFQSQIQSKISYQFVLKQIEKYNLDNRQFFELKQNFYKKSSNDSGGNWFFNFNTLFKKINIFDTNTGEYIKKITHIASVKYDSEKPIKFLQSIFSPTSVYAYEFLKLRTKQRYYFGQKTQDTQKIQISFNENRDEFLASKQFFKVILNISELSLSQIDCFKEEGSKKKRFEHLQQNFQKKVPHLGQLYFTLHFRQYFQNSISQFVCSSPNCNLRTQNLTAYIIKLLYKISFFLHPVVSQLNKTKIQTEILKLQKQLYLIIKQKGFESFLQYLQSEKEKKMIKQSQRLSMQTSIIKFESKQGAQELNSSQKKKSNKQKKKKSIFGSLKKINSQSDSSTKDMFSSMKVNQTLKIVQIKMMHLQLLRFLLKQSQTMTSSKILQNLKNPLYQIFQSKFTIKYVQSKDNEYNKGLIYQKFGIKFNSEDNYECNLQVKVNSAEFSLYCQFSYQTKLILKCNIKDFYLSEPYSINQQELKNFQVIQEQNYTLTKMNISQTQEEYLITIEPTINTLGFKSKQAAKQFLNKINQIKFQFKELKDSSVLQYLDKQDQVQNKN